MELNIYEYAVIAVGFIAMFGFGYCAGQLKKQSPVA